MNVSSVTKHFPTANKGFITTLGSTISGGAATVPLTSVSGLNNGDVFVGIIEPGDPNEQEFTGTVDTAGVQITGVKWTDGTNVDHTAGVTIVDYVSATGQNIQTKGILEEHKQTGAHSDITADSIVVTGDVTAANFIQSGGSGADGWTVGLPAVSSVTALGNRSYTVAFASTVASILSEGMRLRTTRTVASTQNAFSLDGSNDYYSKTSPNGLSFTTTYTCAGWIYLTSYATAGIIARRNADTEGWSFYLNSSGQVVLDSLRIASNQKIIVSYQSVPLNRWVHVAATMDCAVGDTSAQKIWIDGVEVPRSYTLTGTLTALVQGTTALVVGSAKSAGTGSPFPGYIDQAAVFSSQLSDATIKAMMHQGLTGSESTLVSAYANGSTTDLSANANNLTAQNGATTVASAPWGNRGASTTLDYGLVMAVSGTDVTVQVPEGVTIPTTGGVSAVAYSTQANPFGWVSDKGRWALVTVAYSQTTQNTPGQNVWYNLNHRIYVPIGGWSLGYQSCIAMTKSVAGAISIYSTLSDGAATNSDRRFAAQTYVDAGETIHTTQHTAENSVSVSTATTYYLNAMTDLASAVNNITIAAGGSSASVITATPSSL